MTGAVILGPNRAYPSFPDPDGTPENTVEILRLMKEAVEIGERRSGSVYDSYLRVRDMLDLGLLNIDEQSGTITAPDDDTDASTTHNHDSLYYRKTVSYTSAEVDALLANYTQDNVAETITASWTFSTRPTLSGAAALDFDPGAGNDSDMRWLENGTLKALVRWDSSANTFAFQDRDPSAVNRFYMDLETGNFTATGGIYPGGQTTGKMQAVSGEYGSVEVSGVDGSAGGVWEGYSIDGRFVFMAPTSEQRCGIYDDVDNQWAIQWNIDNATAYEELALYTGANVVAAYTQDPAQAGVTSGMRLRHPNAVYYDAGYQQMPRTITNASATLSNEDAGGYFYSNNATTYTITLNSQTDFPVEACFFILNYGTGNVTIAPGTGSLIWVNAGSTSTGTRTVGPRSVATILHYSAGTWFIWGDNIS